jgi:hypothetical protein
VVFAQRSYSGMGNQADTRGIIDAVAVLAEAGSWICGWEQSRPDRPTRRTGSGTP